MPGGRAKLDRPSKKLQREYRGARRDGKKPERPSGDARASVVADRRGRPVAVERYGKPPPAPERREEPRKERPRKFTRSPAIAVPTIEDPARDRAILQGKALMRVVGGRLRGRSLAAPKSKAIRPTADRLRESLFNILLHAYGDPIGGARVLDLFAGTGALGIEAASRGAAFVQFVDDGAEARALLRENVTTLGLGGVTRIFRRDATKLGPAYPVEPFSLAFLDPPYGQNLAAAALAAARVGGWLVPDALVVVEEATKSAFAAPERYCELERRVYDDTEFVFLKLSWA